jgi:hypothetical protein
MDEYKEIIEYYKSTLIFKLSQIGYALNCDLLFSDRLELLPLNKCFELIKYLKDGNKVFIDYWFFNNNNIENFYAIINNIKLLNIKLIFYIQAEPYLPSEIFDVLLPISYRIYAQNNNYSHPNVHYMPIGIRDCGNVTKEIHPNFYHSYLLNEGLKNVNKEHLCLIGGMGDTHLERILSYNYLKDLSFVYDISKFNYSVNITSHYGKIPIHKYYDFIHRSIYIVSPPGVGVDCYRFFESIYLKSIPIVKRTNTVFDKAYNIFPCLIVNNWSDITFDLLKLNLPDLQRKMNDFHIKYPNFYTDTSVLDKLLLET